MYYQLMCDHGVPVYVDLFGNIMSASCEVPTCENYKGEV